MGIRESKHSARFELKTMSPPLPVVKEMDRLTREIELRAFLLFEQRGSVHGFDVSDWLLAESQIAPPIPIDVDELECEIVIRAEVPGFKREDLFVIADSCKVKIYGRVDRRNDHEKGEERDPVVQRHTDIFPGAIRREIELPAVVDSDKAFAQMSNGLLELHFPKLEHQNLIETAAA